MCKIKKYNTNFHTFIFIFVYLIFIIYSISFAFASDPRVYPSNCQQNCNYTGAWCIYKGGNYVCAQDNKDVFENCWLSFYDFYTNIQLAWKARYKDFASGSIYYNPTIVSGLIFGNALQRAVDLNLNSGNPIYARYYYPNFGTLTASDMGSWDYRSFNQMQYTSSGKHYVYPSLARGSFEWCYLVIDPNAGMRGEVRPNIQPVRTPEPRPPKSLDTWNPDIVCYQEGLKAPAYANMRFEIMSPKESTWRQVLRSTQATNMSDGYLCDQPQAKKSYNSEVESTFGYLTRICREDVSGGGVEGNYSIKLVSDHNILSGNESNCTMSNLFVDWNLEKDWCEDISCGNGNYLEQAGECCSPRQMFSGMYNPRNNTQGISIKGDFRYTNEDCAKLLLGNTQLCFYSFNPTWTTLPEIMPSGSFLNSSKMPGIVVYPNCNDLESTPETLKKEGPEFLSANLTPSESAKWIPCTNLGFNTSGTYRKTIKVLGNNSLTKQLTNEFICVDWIAPRANTIAECAGESLTINNKGLYGLTSLEVTGGILAFQGQSVNISNPNSVYFCTNKSTWSKDLDDKNLVGINGFVCNQAKFPPNDEQGYNERLSSPKIISYPYDNPQTQIKWTGNYCCGEPDDWYGTYPSNRNIFTTLNEYYNDPNGTGACFNSWPQLNGDYLKIYKNSSPLYTPLEVREVIIWNGTFQGCAINHTQALIKKSDDSINDGKVKEEIKCAFSNNVNKPYNGTFRIGIASPRDYGFNATDNDFLLLLKDNFNSSLRTTGAQLIKDNEYCNIKKFPELGKYYFCSYNETWIPETDLTNFRTHLSFIPWNDSSVQQAECCLPTECWNGTECIPSVLNSTSMPKPHKIMNSNGDGFVCKDGKWEFIYKKTTWDGSKEGYCFNNNQCLLDPEKPYLTNNTLGPLSYPVDVIMSGDGIKKPSCINSSEYYLDHYCENGTWTTRTKYVALELYNLVRSTNPDYTLYCDKYDKVLNKADYFVTQDRNTLITKYFEPLVQASREERCYGYDKKQVACANYVCVMVVNPNSENKQVYFGTSINHVTNKTKSNGQIAVLPDFGTAFGRSLENCPATNEDRMVNCGNGLYFNNKKKIVILSRDIQLSSTPLTYNLLLQNLFTNFIYSLVKNIGSMAEAGYDYQLFDQLAEDLYEQTGTQYTKPIMPVFDCPNCADNKPGVGARHNQDEVCAEWPNPRKIHDFNSLYLSKVGNKKVFGLAEYEAEYGDTVPVRYAGFRFEGFNQNLCDIFKLGDPIGPPGYRCIEKDNNYYFVFTTKSFNFEFLSESSGKVNSLIYPSVGDEINEWKFLGTSLRIK